jgi:tRNA threonylcarbamoyladenosine biosynthesis protein TsaB
MLVAEVGAEVVGSHAARLLPMVDGLLAIAGWSKTSLDAYAAVRGPGSFTGVRVALGLARGMALAAARPCVGVGTLDAMAEAYGPSAVDRVPLVDAGRGEVYGARFDPSGSPPGVLVAAWVGNPALAVAGAVDVVVFGGGARVHARPLRDAGYAGPIGHAPTSVAAAAGRIAVARLAAGTVVPGDLAPLYVRPADAEVRFR